MSRAWKIRIAVYLLLAAAAGAGTWYAFKWAEDRPPGRPDVVYATTPQEVVEKMLVMARVSKDDVLYDLGCGDGRFMVTAAKRYGCRAVGYEIQGHLVELARKNAADAGVAHLVEVHERDIFAGGGVDLRPATVLALYLLPQLNDKLIPRIKEMRPGSRVVSYTFGMTGVRPKQEIVFKQSTGHERRVFLWETPLEFEEEP